MQSFYIYKLSFKIYQYNDGTWANQTLLLTTGLNNFQASPISVQKHAVNIGLQMWKVPLNQIFCFKKYDLGSW